MLKKILRIIRSRFSIVDYLVEWIFLISGALVHQLTGKTPKRSHYSLVTLFIKSQGRINDFLSSILSRLFPPYKIEETSGVLQNLSQAELDKVQKKLEEDGCYIFEQLLPSEFCERILQKSLRINYLLRSDEIAERKEILHAKYDPNNPVAARYNISEHDVLDIAEIQELLCDPLLIKIAQNYLKSKSIFTGINLFWSAKFKETPDSYAAQEFHFDMERIKWLRYFIYLTDVDSHSGPHCFIKGSHRTGAIPQEFLDQGYVRHRDEIILKEYGEESYVEFTGPKGTIFAEDSRGLHKGKLPNKGDRLLLAFELSNSTFGTNNRGLIRNIYSPQFGKFCLQYPRLYLNFDFETGLLQK